MLTKENLFKSLIDVILLDEVKNKFEHLLEEYIYNEQCKILYNKELFFILLEIVNLYSFIKENNIISLAKKIIRDLHFTKYKKTIYSNKVLKGKINKKFLVQNFLLTKKNKKLKITIQDRNYNHLCNKIFFGILYNIYINTTKNINYLKKHFTNTEIKILKEIEELMLSFNDILFKENLTQQLINEYKQTPYILNEDNLYNLKSLHYCKKEYTELFSAYLIYLKQENIFYSLSELNENKLFEIYILKALFLFFKEKIIEKNLNALVNKDKNAFLVAKNNNIIYKVFFQNSSRLKNKLIEKYTYNLEKKCWVKDSKLIGIPDIIIEIEDENKEKNRKEYIILDAKYKKDYNLREDRYQMLGYTRIFNLKKYNLFLIYPHQTCLSTINGYDIFKYQDSENNITLTIAGISSLRNYEITNLFTLIFEPFL